MCILRFFAPSSVWTFLGGLPIFSMPRWNQPSCQMNLYSVFEGTTHWLSLEPSWVSTFSVARTLDLELSTVVISPLGVFSLRGCGKQRQQPAVWHLGPFGLPILWVWKRDRGPHAHGPLAQLLLIPKDTT